MALNLASYLYSQDFKMQKDAPWVPPHGHGKFAEVSVSQDTVETSDAYLALVGSG